MTENSTKPPGRPGRPRGIGYDDGAVLEAIEAYMAAHPDASTRAAIAACLDRAGATFEADFRRLQRKMALKQSAPTVRDLLAKPFEFGAPRKTEMWNCRLDVPVPDVEGDYGITWSVVVGRPVILVVLGEDPVGRAAQPDHPLFEAVEALPVRHDFDHPDYRLICERVGLDPDRYRPAYIEDYEDAVDLLRDSPTLMLASPATGAALELFRGAQFQPWALRRVLELETEPDRAARVLDQAKAAMRAQDWDGRHLTASLRMLANPWGYAHESSVWFGVAPDGNLTDGVVDMPLFLEPPHPHDLAGRMLALLHERNQCALVLSPEELENWTAGGDGAHWLRDQDCRTKAADRARPAACDLSMTRALRQTLISVCYDGYLARKTGEPFDPQGRLAYEKDGRNLPPSMPAPPRRDLPAPLRLAAWHLSETVGRLRRARRDRVRAATPCTVRLVHGGELTVTVYADGEIGVRCGRILPWIDRRPVEISVTFGHDGRRRWWLPKIHRPDFRMSYADGECLPKHRALPMLDEILSIAATLPVPLIDQVTPRMAWMSAQRTATDPSA